LSFQESPINGVVDEALIAVRGPVVEGYKKDIDRTLLRANLKLTVTERFRRGDGPHEGHS
jgi:hypothetical protein